MLSGDGVHNQHEKFRELCALADSGSLTPLELSELELHLRGCEACRQIFGQFRALKTQGMTALADMASEIPDAPQWDSGPALQRLLDRVSAERHANLQGSNPVPIVVQPGILRSVVANRLVRRALAACIVVAAGYGGYCLGTRKPIPNASTPMALVVEQPSQKLWQDKKATEELLEVQARKVAELERQSSEKEQELDKLRSALRALEDRSKDLMSVNSQTEEQLQALSRQRDALNSQLQSEGEAFAKDRTELSKLRSERDGTLLRTASLETQINELTATNRDQERRLKDAEQYLSSDRDIRELMGARKLYIADVFDVDGSSRTQKPFGRVFYTQGKSLVFYAFDLDRQPKVVNASTFQVWGQREAPQGEEARPTKLGILYMDSEANRRWVMRIDDPKQLAEIDAVFVTVEPHGGSPKPTSKPFLYALLRNEANHP